MHYSSDDSIILLLGAGASSQLELPTLDDLLKQAVIGNDDIGERIRQTRNSIEASPKRFNKAVFEELIVRIKEYLKLTYLLRTDQTYRKELPILPFEIDNGQVELKWKKALTRCYRVMLEEYGPRKIDSKSENFKITLKLFKEISKLNNNSLHIFTTNYDCSYQVLGSHSKDLKFVTHIDNNDGHFKNDWFVSRKEFEAIDLPLIYIHRLHGCVAWFNAKANDDIFGENSGIIEEVFGAGENLIINDDDYLNNMCIKLVATQLLGTNPVFSTAFEEFTKYLKNAKILIVWGYSFRDLMVLQQINNMYSNFEHPIKIFFVDPYLNESDVINNIRNTFHSLPIPLSPLLKPKKIDWCPTEGFNNIINKIKKTLLNELKNGNKK